MTVQIEVEVFRGAMWQFVAHGAVYIQGLMCHSSVLSIVKTLYLVFYVKYICVGGEVGKLITGWFVWVTATID